MKKKLLRRIDAVTTHYKEYTDRVRVIDEYYIHDSARDATPLQKSSSSFLQQMLLVLGVITLTSHMLSFFSQSEFHLFPIIVSLLFICAGSLGIPRIPQLLFRR
jgi:hypothetical protein